MKPGSSSVLEATIAGVVRLAAVWSALVVGASGRSAARAGTIWDGGGGDTNLTTAANWDDDSAPTFTGGTSTLTFGTGGSTATVDTAADLARIILDRDSAFEIANGSGSLTLQGEDVGGVVVGITAGPATADTTVAYTISEQIALGQSQSWDVANNGAGTTSLSVSGVISGAAANLTKLGSGTLTLSAANSFTGVMSIDGGTVSVGSWNLSATNGVWGNQTNNPASPATTFIQMNGGRINYTGASASGNLRGVNLASGTNTIDVASGATLNLGGFNTFQSNGGNLVKEGAGTLQLGSPGIANNVFTGKATINSGTLDWFGAGSMPFPASLVSDFLTINNGAAFALSYNDAATTVSANIGVRLSGNATIMSGTASNASHTIAGPIADGASAGSLIKTGAGMLTLTGSNSYTGSTTVSTGTLKLGSTGSLASSNAISVASGATFDVSSLAGGLTIAASQSLGGAGSIIGSLVFSGDSKLDFTSSLTVNSGTVTFNGFGIDDILGLDGTVVSAGTYTLLGGFATFDLTNALNVGAGNAADIGGGKSAYLQAGSLQVVVVPEPGSFALATLGMAAVAYGCRRRRS